jgi:hypothetical protein
MNSNDKEMLLMLAVISAIVFSVFYCYTPIC